MLKTLTSPLISYINFIQNFCSFILFILKSCIRSDITVKSSIKFHQSLLIQEYKNLSHSLCYFMIADNIYIINTVFEIQVLSTSAIKCRGKFRIFQFASAMRRQKKRKKLPLAKLKPLHITSAMASAYLGIFPGTLIWFFNSLY